MKPTIFTLEDYATLYRSTRDAYTKAAVRVKLATGPYKAAKDAYFTASVVHAKSLIQISSPVLPAVVE